MRDLYSAFGWIGTGGVAFLLGVQVLVIAEPHRWWHIPFATTDFVIACIPWLAAFGTLRHLARTHARARHNHANREWQGGGRY